MDSKSTNAAGQRHVLFDLSPIDPDTDELEEKTKRCYLNLRQMINGKSPKERHEAYTKYIAANPTSHTDELTMGLLVAILVEQEGRNDYYGDVVAFSKDNLNLFAAHMNSIITERISRLSSHSIRQIFWITRQLIKANVAATENTCSNLIRQTAKGDLSPRNLFMAENLIELLCDTRSWLISTNTFIGPTVVFNIMRMIMDHSGPAAQKALRKRETDFVISLIRERFEFVLLIGKDFLRLLHTLTRLPEFQILSHDIYVNNPKLLSPKYEGPHQLLALRTPRRLFQSCLTYDMERKIQFLATGVNFGSQKRYQDWFTKQFLSGAESTLLRCDLIRYICTVIHPTNEVLCSNIIPRWAIIGWLLTTSVHVISSCRLALFLDWFTYDQTDNIMNIEPAILVMTHSIRAHPQVTSCLLDFLCRAPAMFHPKISEQIKTGIRRSLLQILEKRVLPSLKPIFCFPKYDPSLRALIKESFPEHCQSDNGISLPAAGVEPPAAFRVCVPANSAAQQSYPATISHVASSSPVTNHNVQSPAIVKKHDTRSSSHYTSPASHNAEPTEVIPTVDDPNVIIDSETIPKVVSLDSDTKTTCNNLSTKESSPKTPPIQSAEAALNHQRGTVIRSPDVRVDHVENDRQNNNLHNEPHVIKATLVHTSTSQRAGISVLTAGSTNHVTEKSGANDNDVTIVNCTGPQVTDAPPTVKQKLILRDSVLDEPVFENKIQFPCMKIDRIYPSNISDVFSETVCQLLDDLNTTRTNPAAISELIAEIDGLRDFGGHMIELIGDCLANSFARDFTTRIHPSHNCDTKSLKESLSSPLFSLCAEAFSNTNTDEVSRPMVLLAYIGGVLKATGFLIIYYLRVQNIIGGSGNVENYFAFHDLRCPAETVNQPEECENHFENDLRMMYEYDPAMLSLVLPLIFSYEFTAKFNITNNDRIVRLAMSALDPISMNDLISYSMTGTTKVVSRDAAIQDLIKFSLDWPSWEQFSLWKIISAQNVAVESYLPILEELSAKQHAEAVSSIMLNLQKIQEPDHHVVTSVISSYAHGKEQFVASILRYWAMRTDVKSLVKHITSLLDQPPVKRKGQPKTQPKPLSMMCYKTLGALEMIRLKAPRNKIFSQPELFENLSLVEPLCDEMYKKKFAKLFDMQPKQAKKKKLDKET